MILPANKFPMRDLNDAETEAVQHIIGSPAPKEQFVKLFLRNGGRPYFEKNTGIAKYMVQNFVRTTDSMQLDAGQHHQAFITGALFYAASLDKLTDVDVLPYHPSAAAALTERSTVDFLLDGHGLVRDTLPRFAGLLSQSVRVVAENVPNDRSQDFALVGAGAVHMLARASSEAMIDDAMVAAEAAWLIDGLEAGPTNQDLTALESMFEQLPPELQ